MKLIGALITLLVLIVAATAFVAVAYSSAIHVWSFVTF